MGDFFSGWRWKIGCLTLLMASVFMAGWVTSLANFNQVRFPLSTHQYLNLVSLEQSFRIVWECDKVESSTWSDAGFFSMSIQDCDNLEPDWRAHVGPDDFCLNMPFRLRRKVDWVQPQTYSVRTMSLPYSTVVIPLTLLSALLLLSRPRKSNQVKITEPIPAGEA